MTNLKDFPDAVWTENDQEVWLSTIVKFYRNLEDYKFPAKLSQEERTQVMQFIGNTLLNHEGLADPKLLPGQDLAPMEKEYLYEFFLGTDSFHQAHAGDGFVLDDSGRFLAVLNVREHLQLYWVDTEGEIERAWNQLAEIETGLGESLKYAYSPVFGFQTANVHRSGTGLKVHAFLQVPALIQTGRLKQLTADYEKKGLFIRGMHAALERYAGDVVVLTNYRTLGVNEEEVLASIRAAAIKLMVAERGIRAQLSEEEIRIFKSKVARAFGLLHQPFQLETIETLDALSALKFGAYMGWVKGASNQLINNLFFSCRRGSLVHKFSTQAGLAQERAALVRERLKDTTLLL